MDDRKEAQQELLRRSMPPTILIAVALFCFVLFFINMQKDYEQKLAAAVNNAEISGSNSAEMDQLIAYVTYIGDGIKKHGWMYTEGEQLTGDPGELFNIFES